jgi:hypothetical protein
MKTTLTFGLIAFLLPACDYMYVEPAYDYRSRVEGNYWVEEYSETYNNNSRFRISISRWGYDEIVIDNFYDVNIRVRARFDYNKIFIPRQVVDGYELEGVGTLYGDEIEFTYKVRDTYSYKPADFCYAKAW